jgi:hypothetical protein
MPATKSAPKAQPFPPAPSSKQLTELVDWLGTRKEKAEKKAAELREKKKLLDADIRAADREVEEIKAYCLKQLDRLQLSEVEGEKWHAWVCDNTRPTFEHECPASVLPEEFRSISYKLNDAAALRAYAEGTLPPELQAKVGRYVRLDLR